MAIRTRYEQETVINYNEEEKTASVFTYNRSLQKKLDSIAAERPDECQVNSSVTEGAQRSSSYTIPKSWVKIRPSRILTDAQKDELRERAAKMHGKAK